MPPSKLQAECPRCGYDLSGTTASWRESCPLEGRCSECGLEFWWYQIVSLEHAPPPWSFEHLRYRVRRGWFKTAKRSLRPAPFWRALRMEHAFVPRRLYTFCLGWALMIFVVLATSYLTFLPQYVRGQIPWGTLRPASTASEMIQAFRLWADTIIYDGHPARSWWDARLFSRAIFNSASLFVITIWALVPLTFVTLRHSLKIAGIRPRHLARIAAYSLSIPCFLYALGVALSAILIAMSHQFIWYGGGPNPSSIPQLGRMMHGVIFICIFNNLDWFPLIVGPLMIANFWFRALRSYLKLPHSLAIACLLTLLATLLAFLGLMWTPAFKRFIELTI